MQEKEFEQLEQTCDMKECTHPNVVKLYYLGTHSDYGCTSCKLKSLVLEHFNRNKLT